ncbi:hypothetical protein TWF281_000095 [Arthrobotrys megalospora]
MRLSNGLRITRRPNPFETFPAEINLLIIKNLRPVEILNLSRCSKLCYLLCFPLRFDTRTVILTHESIKLFQDGGLCEQLRPRIRSVYFNKPQNWSKTILARKESEADYEQTITQLRIWTNVLTLFPNIRELYVSYAIPWAVENNAYAAVFGIIANLPFYSFLERLEFQVYKDGHNSYRGIPILYETILSGLSAENQDFLGKRISDEQMDETIRSIASGIPEPQLTAARIAVNGIAPPLTGSKRRLSEGPTFYYVPLTLASDLKDLEIEITKGKSEYNPEYNVEGEERESYFEPSILKFFSGVTELRLSKTGTLTKSEIDRLVERFPNLEVLEISQSERCQRDESYLWRRRDREHRYDGIVGLKYLEDLTLPWPAYSASGSIAPDKLERWISQWVEKRLYILEAVSFEGMRYMQTEWREGWDDIMVSFAVDTLDHYPRINARGDTYRRSYEDLRLEPKGYVSASEGDESEGEE